MTSRRASIHTAHRRELRRVQPKTYVKCRANARSQFTNLASVNCCVLRRQKKKSKLVHIDLSRHWRRV